MITVGVAAMLSMPTVAMDSYDNNVGITPMTYDSCVSTPIVDESIVEYVQDYQLSKAKSLIKAGFKVEIMRNREVIIIIIPTQQLFKPNSSEITAKGIRRLQSLIGYLGEAGFYRIIVAGYTDNTGSQSYCLRHSGNQAVAISDWLRGKLDGGEIYEFGLGNADPLFPNNTMDNRSMNRRIEILLVPGKGLISQAGK